MAWYVYLLRCQDGSLYIGTTTDPARRFREHAGAGGRGAKYTAAKKPERFECVFQVPDRSPALRLEARLKKLSHAQREALADGAPLPSDAPEARRIALAPDGTAQAEPAALLSRETTTHHMNLNPAPYEMIKSGLKTIELRLFDEKRQKIKPGDTIVFTNTDTGETLLTTVLKLHCFQNFEQLYQTLPLLQCGYREEDIAQAKPSDMEQYYATEEQKKYGVVGIELFLQEETPDDTQSL